MPQVAPGLIKHLASDVTPLSANETRVITVSFDRVKSLGGDISADKNCTLQIFPILSNGTRGKGSVVLSVTANSPERYTFMDLYTNKVDIEIINTEVSAMTNFCIDVYGVI